MKLSSFLLNITFKNYGLLLVVVVLTSCMGTRYLPSNSTLLIKDPKIDGIPKNYRKNMESLIQQKPNKRLFGFLPIAYLTQGYHLGRNFYDSSKYVSKISRVNAKYQDRISGAKSDKKRLKYTQARTKRTDKLQVRIDEGNWLMRIGEPLAVYDSSLHASSAMNMERYLSTIGHFKSTVVWDAKSKSDKKTAVTYSVNLAKPYFIDSINYVFDDPAILLIFQNTESAFIKKGQKYNQQNIDKERENVLNQIKDEGYFAINRNQITYQIDTSTLENRKIILTQRISSPNIGQNKKYKIDSIIFSNQISGRQDNQVSISRYNNITYRFGADKYRKKVLDYKIFVRPDSLYSRQLTLETQQQLSYLDAFKFVNINYDSTVSDGLVATVFTSPLSKYQTSNEIGFIQDFSQSQQFPSPFLNLGIKKRNAFGGLETLELNGNFAILGITNVETSTRNYSLFEYGGRLRLTFPQFIFPLPETFKRKVGSFNPKTAINATYSYEFRVEEYERSRLNTGFSYLWRIRDEKQFVLTPLTFSFIDIKNTTDSFRDFLNQQDSLGNGSIVAAFKPTITSSTSFDAKFNNNAYGNLNTNSSYQSVFIETGGNLADLFNKEVFNDTTYAVFKWTKVNTEYRKLFIFRDFQLSTRFNLGAALSYGPTPSLPYEKRFYGGGSNSMRAWSVRRIGPGAYGIIREPISEDYPVALVDYQLEQGGEMIIEGNVELRKKLSGFIDYALFLDIGNIWIVNNKQIPEDQDGDNGTFKFNSFYKEFGIAAGIGIRFDFSFLVFRLDGAVQVVDPAQPLGSRYILDKIDLLAPVRGSAIDKDIFRNKTNLNIGIGLPF